jgi:RES domain-containing protein
MSLFGLHFQNTCPCCFAHTWLQEYVLTQSTERGTCPSCRSRKQPLLPVSNLYHAFENLLSSYQLAEGSPVEQGRAVVDLIQEDWEVFSERVLLNDGAGRLLEAIMYSGWDKKGGEPPLGQLDHYVARHRRWGYDTFEDIWKEFAEEVKSNPSQPLKFGDNLLDSYVLNEVLIGNRTEEIPEGAVFFRARLGFVRGSDGGKPYGGEAIGAPPYEKAGPGRANAKGQVVLYCTDEESTAISEVRPARGEYVSVAEVRGIRKLEILDLVTEPKWPNPFTDNSVSHRVEIAGLLSALAEQLSMPLRSRDDPTDYIPTQKLVELIQTAKINGKTRIDGIRYPSAMAPKGTNVVFFDPLVVHIGTSRLVEILETNLEYQETSIDS